jgi:hypothetical protein
MEDSSLSVRSGDHHLLYLIEGLRVVVLDDIVLVIRQYGWSN